MKERIRGDRRTKGRFEVVGTLPGTLETWHRHRVRNVGAGGALLESATPLPAGSRWSARLILQGSHRDIKAEVRYAYEDRSVPGTLRYLVGIAWGDGSRPIDDLLSAGTSATGVSPTGVERRQSPRTPLTDGTELTRADWATVTVLDISISGVLFLAPQRMAVGDRGQLRLRLGDSSFVGDIEVRRSDKHPTPSGGYRIGAAFIGMPDSSRVTLEDFIAAAGH